MLKVRDWTLGRSLPGAPPSPPGAKNYKIYSIRSPLPGSMNQQSRTFFHLQTQLMLIKFYVAATIPFL